MSHLTSRGILLLALPLLSPLPLVHAAESIEEIVITPNRIPVPLRQIGTSVAVMDRADIEAHGNLALLDVLRQLPSVATSANGGIGQPASLRIRGEEGFRTLAIIDGIRLSDPSGTQVAPQFEHVLSSGIERVEVLRGPQGLGYGADAGGVVSLATRQGAQGLQTAIEAQGGANDTQQFVANAGGANAVGDFFLSAADSSTAGFNIRSNDTTLRDDDGYDNTTVHGRAGINIADGWRAELTHRRVDGDSKFDDCGFGVIEHDCVAVYDLTASRVALDYSSDRFSHSLSFASTDTRRDSLAAGFSTFATNSELERWEYVGSVKDLGPIDLVLGADQERATMPDRQRDNVGYFAEALGQISDVWYVTAGMRYDDNDDFGSNTSYRISTAYVLEVNGGVVKFKGSAGTGFRAPSLYEIAYNQGPWSQPPASSTTLLQEKSKGIEAGIEYSADNGLQLEVVYFDQAVEDAIIFDLNAYSGYLQELGSSNSHGVELSATVPVMEQLSLQANYSWNPTERPDGSQRLRRPEQLANLGLSWHPQQRLQVNAFLRVSQDSVDQPFGAGVVQLDDFAVLDLNTSYQVNDRWQLFGRIENALGEEYEEVVGYNTVGTAAYIGFRLNFASR